MGDIFQTFSLTIFATFLVESTITMNKGPSKVYNDEPCDTDEEQILLQEAINRSLTIAKLDQIELEKAIQASIQTLNEQPASPSCHEKSKPKHKRSKSRTRSKSPTTPGTVSNPHAESSSSFYEPRNVSSSSPSSPPRFLRSANHDSSPPVNINQPHVPSHSSSSFQSSHQSPDHISAPLSSYSSIQEDNKSDFRSSIPLNTTALPSSSSSPLSSSPDVNLLRNQNEKAPFCTDNQFYPLFAHPDHGPDSITKKKSSRRPQKEPTPCSNSPSSPSPLESPTRKKEQNVRNSKYNGINKPTYKLTGDTSQGLGYDEETGKENSDDNNYYDVVVDGANVACSHGNVAGNLSRKRRAGSVVEIFSVKGIIIVYKHFVKRNKKPIIFVPRNTLIAKSRQEAPNDIKFVEKLCEDGFVCLTPSQTHDDNFILRYASKYDLDIVSNDRFKKEVEVQENDLERVKVESFLKERLIPYTFVGDEFIPNPNPRRLFGDDYASRDG